MLRLEHSLRQGALAGFHFSKRCGQAANHPIREINVKHGYKALAAATAAAGFMMSASAALAARDQVKIAGSSTVLPYANIVAEQFGKTFNKLKTPIVESGGSSAGLKQFCAGLGESGIDIANSSRPIRPAEREECAKNGVTDVVEVRFGYDGIVFASDARARASRSSRRIGTLPWPPRFPAPTASWPPTPTRPGSRSMPSFPEWTIAAYIPGEKHGTREVFEEKTLHAGCVKAGAHEAMVKGGMDKAAADKACIRVRKDGVAVDIDGDYTETLARLQSNKQGIGVFGLSFYENNTDKLKVATMGGICSVGGDGGHGQVPGVAPAVLLRQEGARRRHPGPEGIRRVLHV